MENADIISSLALGLSIITACANGLYTLNTNKKLKILEKEKILADVNNKKELSIKTLKTEIHEYRKALVNISKKEIKIEKYEKDIYSFCTVLTIQNLKDCLGANEYKKYLDLESEIDTVLDEIIYKKDFSKIFNVTHKIKYFLENINEIKFD